MPLAQYTRLPYALPALALDPDAPPLVVPTADDLALAALQPSHWYDASSWLDGVWRDKGAGDRTLVSLGAVPPTVQAIAGDDFLIMNNTSQLGAADAGPLIDDVAEFTIAVVRHARNGTDHDPILGTPATEIASGTNKILNLTGYSNSPSNNEYIQLSVEGGTTVFYTAAFPAVNPSRAAPLLILISYSIANGWRMRLNSGATYSAQLAAPAANQLITNGRLQIGRAGGSTGVASYDFGGVGDIMVFPRDLTKTAHAADLATLIANRTAKYGLAA